jgi:hypothetical protein
MSGSLSPVSRLPSSLLPWCPRRPCRQWTNPHIYTSIETTDVGGKTVVYRVEGGPPNALFRQGWRKDSLKVGEVVTVSGIRAKSATSMNVGQATITTSDGRKMFGTGGTRPRRNRKPKNNVALQLLLLETR